MIDLMTPKELRRAARKAMRELRRALGIRTRAEIMREVRESIAAMQKERKQ